MTISLYQASIPVFIKALTNLSNVLGIGEAHCIKNNIDQEIFINARLFPDMLPLSRQIQIASDGTKGFAARMAGVDIPSYPDTETSFAELEARIQKTIAYLKGFSAKDIDAKEEKDIVLKFGPKEFKFKGLPYLVDFALPNLYFHTTTAYAILRHNGVVLTKKDFLGG